VIVHMPMSFIHDLVGLLGGGGGASFLVDVFVQYLFRNEPETHFCLDFSSEAASTPLYNVVRVSSGFDTEHEEWSLLPSTDGLIRVVGGV